MTTKLPALVGSVYTRLPTLSILPASTEHNNKKDKLLHLSHHFSLPFHCCLSVVLWPEEGDFPESLHRVVYVIINKRCVESFMHLDLNPW